MLRSLVFQDKRGSMLTLFAIPRAFVGHIGVIQNNAIRSWTRLRPPPEIILLGDDNGTAEVARECGARHQRAVAQNEMGTPLVSDIFGRAAALGSYDLQCYVNADIILMDDFLVAVRRVADRWPEFLMCGRRWDFAISGPLEFSHGWDTRLRRAVAVSGRLHGHTGMDYFVFRRGLWGEIPPFAVGRTVWDNWLVYGARARGAPVVDATEAIMPVHQDHAYPAFPGGANEAWNSPEARRNLALAGGYSRAFTLQDATWRLDMRRLRPAVRNYPGRLLRFPRRLVSRWIWQRQRARSTIG